VSIGKDFIGPFRMLRLIRSGTTTQVWEALREGEKERVAIKVLLADYRRDKFEIDQLKHEARVGTQLNHPNVIQIYEYYEDQGYPLLSLQLLSARNLKIEMRERPKVLAENMAIVIDAAAKGLAHLHEKGWIHCDIKPDNYLVDEQGGVKLIDFSIARKIKGKGLLGLFPNKPKTIQGTRSYLSPEQIRRQHLDPRADIYGFGCMLYEMLSGKTPFTANTPDELLSKHLSAPIPNVQSVSGATTEMANLIMKMMAKKPDNRIQTMNEFVSIFRKTNVYRPKSRPQNFKRL
jgi:serine/threonine protein kinase